LTSEPLRGVHEFGGRSTSLADADHRVSDRYGMIHPNANNTLTVRSVFIIDPCNEFRLRIT
jgi:alkyl hydroperoxide reductase subunit AhpC